MGTIDQAGNIHAAGGGPHGGQFTGRVRSAPGAPLNAPSSAAERPVVDGQVRLQRWTGPRNDILEEVGTVDIDAAGALDTLTLDQVRQLGDSSDNDIVFESLSEAGIVDHHGPFDVDLDEEQLADYIDARERAGAEQAPRSTVIAPKALLQAKLDAVVVAERELADRKRALTSAIAASAVLEIAPDARTITRWSDGALSVTGPDAEELQLQAADRDRLIGELGELGFVGEVRL